MSNNKSYRIRTDINSNTEKVLNVKVDSDYDILEILSLKFNTENLYKLHTSHYGCVVGRVLANGGVGVPNAKISIFIKADEETSEDSILSSIYPYTTTSDTNIDGIRYNLLPDEQVAQCHQAVGTMPNKRLVLDDSNTLEIFDKYYKFTTVTNGAGDYMIMGVPVGNQTLHMDVDLSDIGFLSQKPIDMTYKGYNISQFENAQMFKKDTKLTSLVQIISQDSTVYVNPFWGDEDMGETISITRHDIDVDYKFEPTCIFMGSMVTETTSNGFSKKCVPTPKMGRMDELTTGSGTIEMIRKTPSGEIESFNINGSELIDGNGVWCYQIPMNLDYITTDEYGNIVPTDNPEKGIATRTSVRFRMSLNDFESDYSNNHLVKVLVPNNPQVKTIKNNNGGISYEISDDYAFGSLTKEESFKDLMWNNVYTVKSFIPRIQKGHTQRSEKFSGFKNVNVHGKNNPIPYNNMRVNITFMFTLQCAIIKTLLWVVKQYNRFLTLMPSSSTASLSDEESSTNFLHCMTVGDGMCPDLEGWYFAPGCRVKKYDWITRTLNKIKMDNGVSDVLGDSIDNNNNEDSSYCLSTGVDYFMQCVEINLAMENEVIQFDFYNDWINGLIYIPRWFVKIKKKATFFFGMVKTGGGTVACNEGFGDSRHYVQQCAMEYGSNGGNNDIMYNRNVSRVGCAKRKEKCHKSKGRKYVAVLNKNGVVKTFTDSRGGNAYYARPYEWVNKKLGVKCNLFATDIVLLGSINPSNLWGIPSDFNGIQNSTFQMPPNLALANTDIDGRMYGVVGNGISKCTSSTKKADVEKIEYTPTSFNKWVSEPDDKNFDNITEYGVTEISGIDWGMSGPNQGVKDKEGLFQPGGHFLGIACSNSQVNIKSCVNLSRICELGVSMSQRQEEIVIDEEEVKSELKQEFIVPSGFISKHELSDTNYRSIFATLNHNNLKTKVSEHDTVEYDFTSIQPTNFNGELRELVGIPKEEFTKIVTKFNAIKNDDESDNSSAQAYFRTFEETSKDYYNFRLGIHDNNEASVKMRYLIHYAGNIVSLPVYENSFYFYFGLANGGTAMDKFLTNYYSVCPNDLDKYAPSVKITNVIDAQLCGHRGGVEFNVDNISIPYTYIITKGNSIIDYNDFCVIENGIKIGADKDGKIYGNGLQGEGTYVLTVKNDMQGVSISESFSIYEELPTNDNANFNVDSLNIIFNPYRIEPEVTFTEKTVYEDKNGNIYDTKPSNKNVKERNQAGVIVVSALEEDMTESIKVKKVSAYNGDKDKPYIIGMVIDDGYYYKMTCLYDTKSDDDIKKINKKIKELMDDEGYVEIENYELTYDNIINPITEIFNLYYYESGYYAGSINHWGENKYNVRIVYSCEKITDDHGKLKTALPIFSLYELVDAMTLESAMELYEFWIHEEKNNLSQLDDVLLIEGNNKNNKIRVDFENLESKLNNPLREWTLKKEMLYSKSVYSGSGHTTSVGVVNGTIPYTETINGSIEEMKDGLLYVREGTPEDVKKGKITLNNIMLPTEPWLNDYNDEFKEVCIFETVKFEKQPYLYSVTDSDGFPALFGGTYKGNSGGEYGEEEETTDHLAEPETECGCEDIFGECDCEDMFGECDCDGQFVDCDCDDVSGIEDETLSW
jgi:hypothetical protein